MLDYIYTSNIKLLNLGGPTSSTDQLGNVTTFNPIQGAVFYNSNAKDIDELTKSAVQRIVRSINKK